MEQTFPLTRTLADGREQVVGYLFDFAGRGVFAPDGKTEIPSADVAAHNRALAELEAQEAKRTGRATLYLSGDKVNGWTVGDWCGGACKVSPWRVRLSFHNFAGRDGRRDVWFRWMGRDWHGVNVGDSQILRCKALRA